MLLIKLLVTWAVKESPVAGTWTGGVAGCISAGVTVVVVPPLELLVVVIVAPALADIIKFVLELEVEAAEGEGGGV